MSDSMFGDSNIFKKIATWMTTTKKSQEQLTIEFLPNIIEHLGVPMYSKFPLVLAELISNAYDADANTITITFFAKEHKVVIEDDGEGLSFNEINDSFLKIGRNRRDATKRQTTKKGRKIIGKKGIGKLAPFGIAKEIKVTTKKAGKSNSFTMNLSKLKDAEKSLKNRYHPQIIGKPNKECAESAHGTIITLTDFKLNTVFNYPSLRDMAKNLARLFLIKDDFKIILTDGKEKIAVENSLRYEGIKIQHKWRIPDDLPEELETIRLYCEEKGIVGELSTAAKPIKAENDIKGVALFSRIKMVSAPSYFSNNPSGHFFVYLTGYLEVDFVDDISDEIFSDAIGTNRQNLNQGHPKIETLYENIEKIVAWIQKDWRGKRKKEKKKNLI